MSNPTLQSQIKTLLAQAASVSLCAGGLASLIDIARNSDYDYPLTAAEILGVLVPLQAQADCLYDSADMVLKRLEKGAQSIGETA